MREYSETHQQGIISIENVPDSRVIKGDLGIQIAKDGRVWISIDGIAFIRFKPVSSFNQPTDKCSICKGDLIDGKCLQCLVCD